MANFELAFPPCLAWEGKCWEHVAGDAGEETVCGISRVANPDWAGWPLVDALKPGTAKELTARILAHPKIPALVSMLYRERYWKVAGKIDDQANATMLLDMAVNMGAGRAVTYLQRALCLMGWTLSIDANLGPHTQGVANAVNQQDLFHLLVAFRCKHYLDIGEAIPARAKFVAGWLNRTFSFSR